MTAHISQCTNTHASPMVNVLPSITILYHPYRSTMYVRDHHLANVYTCFTDGKTSFSICHCPIASVPIDNVFEGPQSGQHTCFTDGKTSFTIRHYTIPSIPSVPIDNVFEEPPSGQYTCFTDGKNIFYHPSLSLIICTISTNRQCF